QSLMDLNKSSPKCDVIIVQTAQYFYDRLVDKYPTMAKYYSDAISFIKALNNCKLSDRAKCADHFYKRLLKQYPKEMKYYEEAINSMKEYGFQEYVTYYHNELINNVGKMNLTCKEISNCYFRAFVDFKNYKLWMDLIRLSEAYLKSYDNQ